jgi:thiol-disulfide isomerase/thioredoxin
MGFSTVSWVEALVAAGKSGRRTVEGTVVFHSHRVSATVATVALAACLALVPNDGVARSHHDTGPSTGLQAIAFGKVPPDFTYDVGNGPTKLSTQFGKPIVINFWATWCGPCLDEMPVFTRLQEDYGEKATLITLSAEETGVARTWVTYHKVRLPIVEDLKKAVFDAYSIGAIPVTIVLRPNGTVSHVSVGELDWTELQAAVDAALRVTARAQS